MVKRGLLILFCMGMMVAGCADQKTGAQEDPEVYSLDLDGNIQMEETVGKQPIIESGTLQMSMSAGRAAIQNSIATVCAIPAALAETEITMMGCQRSSQTE